mgnify:CR=1 FL=1|jgi:hypothetical protein
MHAVQMKPCCRKYEVKKGKKPLELIYVPMDAKKKKNMKVKFDTRTPLVIPYSEDEEPAMVSAYKKAKIQTRKQSGPDLDPKFLPSASLLN